jgi:[calcium/calmodulin-dependent protein kinase] kinase
MSIEDDEENSLDLYLKTNKIPTNTQKINEDELEADKREEEEIFNRYEKIGNLTDIKSIKESEMTKNYDEQGNKYYNDYKLIKTLGKGSYSKVKLVMKDNVKYAMKIVDKKVLKSKKIFKQDKDGNVIITNLLKDALKEIAILKKLNHPNIIKLYEILHNYQKQKIYLIMEYADYGDIMNYNEDTETFSINKHVSEMYNQNVEEHRGEGTPTEKKVYYEEDDLRMFSKDILLGLDYLHKNGIIHHDIKPNNILLCKKKICKITDFNFSSILDNLSEDKIESTGESSTNFRAPETINLNPDEKPKETYEGKPLDMWAFGVTLYILTYLKFPFDSDKGVLELCRLIKEEKVKFPIEPWYSRKIKFLIKQCLEKDPKKRKAADEIMKVLAIHKKEVLDKYKPMFLKKRYTIEVPIEEIVMTLDFISNECNAVIEDPVNKGEKKVLKLKKKLSAYQVPKERSIVKPEIKSNKGMAFQVYQIRTISITQTETEYEDNNHKTTKRFTTVISDKINEITQKGIINKKNDTTVIEGKNILKKYISEK